jgi:hypothetical protein
MPSMSLPSTHFIAGDRLVASHWRLTVALVVSLLVGGCSQLTKNDCLTADWKSLGFQAGSQGQTNARFDAYRKACAKHQITADFPAFNQGHAEGLRHYCTYDQGLVLGQKGQAYNPQCERARYPAFAKGHAAGVDQFCVFESGLQDALISKDPNTQCRSSQHPGYFAGFNEGADRRVLTQRIHEAEQAQARLRDKMDWLNRQIADREAWILSPESTPVTRAQHLSQLNQYKTELASLAQQYQAHEKDIHYLRYQLEGR